MTKQLVMVIARKIKIHFPDIDEAEVRNIVLSAMVSDSVADFYTDCCRMGGYRDIVLVKDTFEAYNNWCVLKKLPKINNKHFIRRMRYLGVETSRRGDGYCFKQLILLPQLELLQE